MQTPLLEDHNIANRTLIEGARRLGYRCKAVPQNIQGPFADHARCGAHCTIACRLTKSEGGKQSGSRGFLEPWLDGSAAEGKLNLKSLEGFEVERLVFETGEKRKVIGAVGSILVDGVSRRLFVTATKVVVAGGTLNSPVILQKSGLKVSLIIDCEILALTPTTESQHRQKLLLPPMHINAFTVAHRDPSVGRRNPDHRSRRVREPRPSWLWCETRMSGRLTHFRPDLVTLGRIYYISAETTRLQTVSGAYGSGER